MQLTRNKMVLALAIFGGIAVLFLAAAGRLATRASEDIVIIEGKSDTGMSASIVARMDDLVFRTYSGDLLVRAADGRIILRTNLMEALDSPGDVRFEFGSIDIKNDTVYLNVRGLDYRGITEFKVVDKR